MNRQRIAAHVFDFSLLSGAAGRKCLTGECMKCEKLLAEHGVYPKCEKLFALLYKEVSVKYILRFPHHRYRSFTFAFG